MTNKSRRRNPRRRVEGTTKRTAWPEVVLPPVFSGIMSNAIWWLGASAAGYLWRLAAVGIAFFAGLLAGAIIWYVTERTMRQPRLFVSLVVCFAMTMLFIGLVFVVNANILVQPPNGPPPKDERDDGPPPPAKEWDFEDGTTQGWGIYDQAQGAVVQSPDLTVQPAGFAQGSACLEVKNIDLEPEPHQTKKNVVGVKKRAAVHYAADLTDAKLTASVYLPKGAKCLYPEDGKCVYADAKFFLFAGPKWDWKESGSPARGVRLLPGVPAEVSWELHPDETEGWPDPWPAEGIIGIQLYVEVEADDEVDDEAADKTSFEGPIYIDNVTVYH